MVEATDYAATILLLSEDSARCTPAVSSALARRILRVVDPRIQTQRILFVPLEKDEEGALCVCANNWRRREGAHRESRRALVKTVSTYLAMDRGFVFFHVDGDVPWSRREENLNLEQFDEFVRSDLRQFITSKGHEAKMDEWLSKLFVLVPYYSIEAWLYQNTQEAVRLCRVHHRGRDTKKFLEWSQARHELDEVEKPKEQVCLRSKYNGALATQAFPAEIVYDVGKSFAAAVSQLRSSPALAAALADTYQS